MSLLWLFPEVASGPVRRFLAVRMMGMSGDPACFLAGEQRISRWAAVRKQSARRYRVTLAALPAGGKVNTDREC